MAVSVAGEIRLWPGEAPGSEGVPSRESTRRSDAGELQVLDVSVPTLTPYLPEPGTETGTAVIVAPGGGFQVLCWDYEGADVAEWLAARGITAFLLKYRVNSGGGGGQEERFATAALAAADGAQAVRLVRGRAAEWPVDPGRVGVMGFSAGGFVATALGLEADPAVRPDFIAPIYGAFVRSDVTPAAPPMFCAVAADDPICLDVCVDAFRAWHAAGRPAELHVYERGSHGFGIKRLGLPVDSWLDRFLEWLDSQGLRPG